MANDDKKFEMRGLTPYLLICLNIIAGSCLATIADLKKDMRENVKEINGKIDGIAGRLGIAERDLAVFGERFRYTNARANSPQ